MKLGECEVILQHNPGRVLSSTAKNDASSIAKRKCFLCRDARPKEQALLEIDGYELLVNPYPIFPLHFTIASAKHEPQMVTNRLNDLVKWTERLDGMTVFYNGAQCGASAPDHMHFQAAPSDMFPLWQWIESGHHPDAPAYIVCKSAEEANWEMNRIKRDSDKEPNVNILARKSNQDCTIVIVPRRQHRPDCYGTDGENCVLVSPAAVEMGGVWCLPREYDFRTLTIQKLKEIIAQTSFTRQEI